MNPTLSWSKNDNDMQHYITRIISNWGHNGHVMDPYMMALANVEMQQMQLIQTALKYASLFGPTLTHKKYENIYSGISRAWPPK